MKAGPRKTPQIIVNQIAHVFNFPSNNGVSLKILNICQTFYFWKHLINHSLFQLTYHHEEKEGPGHHHDGVV